MVPNLQIPAKDIYIANSSDIIKYLYGHLLSLDEEKAKFLHVSPKATEMEEKLDKLGHNLRSYIYYHVKIYHSNDQLAVVTSYFNTSDIGG